MSGPNYELLIPSPQIHVTEDIGDVQKVRVAFLAPDDPPSWFIERLRFQDDHTKDEFTIEVHDWVQETDTEEAVREYPIMWPGVEAPRGMLASFLVTFLAPHLPKSWLLIAIMLHLNLIAHC